MWGNFFKKKEKKPAFVHRDTLRTYTKTNKHFIDKDVVYVCCLNEIGHYDWIREDRLIEIIEK